MKPGCFVSEEKIYTGIFSQVRRIRHETKLAARKIVPTVFGSFANPVEGCLSQFNHPNLVPGILTKYNVERIELEVVMPLAKFSLDKIYMYDINNDKMLSWIRQIMLGLLCLHQHRFVHGDIKPSNILYYDGDNIKLGDFGQSVLIFSDDHLLDHMSYTIQYRPQEVWKKIGWSFSADIWALGCTIFELYYRRCLFPYQKNKDYLQTQDDWFKQKYHDYVDITATYSLPPEWRHPKNSRFNRLLERMLVPKPDTIWDLVNDPLLGLSVVSKPIMYRNQDLIDYLIELGATVECADRIIAILAGSTRDTLTNEDAEFCNRISFRFLPMFA